MSKKCLLCHQSNEQVLLIGRDRLLEIEGKFVLVQCRVCGLIYLRPQPSLASLARYYPENQYPGHSHRNLKEMALGKTLKTRLLRYLYLLSRSQKIKAIEQLQPLDKQSHFLDVGCGNGGFLYTLRETKSIKGVGVELSAKMAAFSRKELGLDVRPGAFLKNRFPDNTFDVVTMFQYFEHETEPLLVLKKTRKILKKKGLLVIELPNIASPLFKFFKSYWFHLDLPRHVFHYSPQTLTEMLKRSGFEIVTIIYHPQASVVTSSMHFLGLSRLFFSLHFLGLSRLFFSSLFLQFPLQLVEQAAGMGLSLVRASDIITVYARKK